MVYGALRKTGDGIPLLPGSRCGSQTPRKHSATEGKKGVLKKNCMAETSHQNSLVHITEKVMDYIKYYSRLKSIQLVNYSRGKVIDRCSEY